MPPIHVVGWVERPRIDHLNKSVRWALQANEEGTGRLINGVVLKLGRYGYEKITWAGKVPSSAMLDIAEASFSFRIGEAYADHWPGDLIAEYGVSHAVAYSLGIKLGLDRDEAVFLGFLLAIAKKGALMVLMLPVAAGWFLVRHVWQKLRPPAS